MNKRLQYDRLAKKKLKALEDKKKPTGTAYGVFDSDKDMTITLGYPLDTHRICSICGEKVKRGIINAANHKCKSNG